MKANWSIIVKFYSEVGSISEISFIVSKNKLKNDAKVISSLLALLKRLETAEISLREPK